MIGLEKEVGRISHYYTNLGVAIVDIAGAVKVGDIVRIKGGTTDFTQEVVSMQIEHELVEEVKSGDVIGLKVDDKVREGDKVLLMEE